MSKSLHGDIISNKHVVAEYLRVGYTFSAMDPETSLAKTKLHVHSLRLV